MFFNEVKFKVLRCGKNTRQENQTIYKLFDKKIKVKFLDKDLSLSISGDGKFGHFQKSQKTLLVSWEFLKQEIKNAC